MLFPGSLAGADQNPPGCTQNNLVVDIGRDKTVVRNGDTINYTVSVSNLDTAQGPACNLTAATVIFVAPAADGTPSGARTTLRAGIDLPAGTTQTVVGTVPYLVATNPGVTDTVAEAMATGVLHDAPANDEADVVKTLGSTVTQPHTTLSASVILASGGSPLKASQPTIAHYTYLEHNDSTTPDPMVSETVTDSGCAPVTLVAGDTGNHLLGPGQTWTYTCQRTLTRPGTYTDQVRASGVDAADGLPAPAETAAVSATVAAAAVLPVTGPPVPLVPLGALGGLMIGLGVLLCRRREAPE